MIKSICKHKFLMIWGILSLSAIHLEAQTHDGGANGHLAGRTRAGREHQWHEAGDRSDGGHQDRSEAQLGRRRRRFHDALPRSPLHR